MWSGGAVGLDLGVDLVFGVVVISWTVLGHLNVIDVIDEDGVLKVFYVDGDDVVGWEVREAGCAPEAPPPSRTQWFAGRFDFGSRPQV